jgi:hypothetical protein
MNREPSDLALSSLGVAWRGGSKCTATAARQAAKFERGEHQKGEFSPDLGFRFSYNHLAR